MSGAACSSWCGEGVSIQPAARCQCGCGGAIPVLRRSRSRPFPRFIKGHSLKNASLDVKTYKEVGDKRVHRLLAERALGKPLPKGAEVHHVDGTISPLSTLVICQDRAYHKLLHVRTRVVRAGGNPNTQLLCSRCKQCHDKSEFYERKTIPFDRRNQALAARTPYCKPCCREIAAARKARRV